MRYLATGLVTLLLSLPALSVELFWYRGTAKDGGTPEYVFQAGEQNSPNAVSREKAAEIAADFMTTFYHSTGWRIGNAGISDNARSILADLLLRHDQGCAPAILLRGSIARWNGRWADSGEAVVGGRKQMLIVPAWIGRRCES